MPKDRIYREPQAPLPPFEFNTAVVDVFDDMIHRSVPMYAEIIRRQARIVEQAYRPGTRIYDLGCSTGNLAQALCARMPAGSFDMVAVDSSRPMLKELEKRFAATGRSADVRGICADIREVALERASVVVANFTLQFVPLADRAPLLQRIHAELVPDGLLLFSEKIIHPDRRLSDLQVNFHHLFKRENGYSELEISQKREALENVLVPETVQAYNDRLCRCRFSGIDIWLKWFNFCSWICIK
jgi:tRNA (cmo5U34)-methyltransferase